MLRQWEVSPEHERQRGDRFSSPSRYRHSVRARRSRDLLVLLAALTVAAALTGLAQSPASDALDAVAAANSLTAAPYPPVRAPSSFVAVRRVPGRRGTADVTINAAATGDLEHVVMPASVHHLGVSTTAVDRRGRIWATLAHGARCTSGVETCGAVPGTCASAVVRISPRTGAVRFVLIGTANEVVEDAQPSPSGKLLAYVRATCTRGIRQYLVVDDLATSRSWTIGKALSPCHSFGSLAWTPNGDALALDYGRAAVRTPHGFVTCVTPPLPSELAVVPALEPARRLPGRRVRMGTNCDVNAVAATRTGFAALEACGRKYRYATGPASLVLFDAALHVTSRSSIGRCLGTSGELRAGPSGSDLLGSIDRHCDWLTFPPPTPRPSMTRLT